jgi:glutathione S-transferase
MFGGAPYDDAKLKKLEEAFEYLDKFLEGQDWAAGSEMTLADITLAASTSTAEAVGFNLTKYSNVTSWLKKCKSTLPGYAEANQAGVEMFKEMFERMTKK